MKKMRNAYKILVAKPEGKISHGRLRHRWKNNVRILGKQSGKVWTGFIWLRTKTSRRQVF
jgi:hypothetical protein